MSSANWSALAGASPSLASSSLRSEWRRWSSVMRSRTAGASGIPSKEISAPLLPAVLTEMEP